MNTIQLALDHPHPFHTMTTESIEKNRNTHLSDFFVLHKEESGYPLPREEASLIQALKSGDEAAFNRMIDLHHSGLMRLARTFVSSEAVAEEVVQDTWVAVIEGIHRFEGRSSLKTWVYRILSNQAKTRGARENKYVPLNNYGQAHDDQEERMNSREFHKTNLNGGAWMMAPISWDDYSPERLFLSKEVQQYLEKAIQDLPPIQKRLLILRDVQGFSSEEACQLLNLTESNQRVLLHRARGRVRRALDAYVNG